MPSLSHFEGSGKLPTLDISGTCVAKLRAKGNAFKKGVTTE